jgi:hypothetical protein
MTEVQKTFVFAGVAAAAILLATSDKWSGAKPVSDDPVGGQKLFADFLDPLTAKSLEITDYDEDKSDFRNFKVAQKNGIWSIPSHQEYPADAAEHLASAANSFIGVDILGLATNSAGDHATYGVINPDESEVKSGATGVGTRVTFKDAKDKVVADLILGKQIKDQPGLRYVRKVGKDAVYRAKLKTDALSTKFEDWIEKDLLKFSVADLNELQLNNYSIQENFTPEGLDLRQARRGEIKLGHKDSKWNVIDITAFKDGKLEPAPLTENEELNNEKLNGMTSALDDLKIVDVERKPEGLTQDLKLSAEIQRNQQVLSSLFRRGFYPAATADGKTALFSSEGEVIASMKDGVNYVLRFGNPVITAGSAEKKNEDAPAGDKKPESNTGRYLMISAVFNPDAIAKPEFTPVPGEEPAAEPAKPADAPAGDAKPADKKEGEAKSDCDADDKEKAAEPEAKTPAADAPKVDAAKADEAKPAEPKAEDKPAAEEKKEEPKLDKKALEERRKAIERENKRKQEDYDAAVKKGEDHVKELNNRFADWYYVISEDVYQKIHLGRADIVKNKEEKKDETKPSTPGEGLNPSDFNALEKKELK